LKRKVNNTEDVSDMIRALVEFVNSTADFVAREQESDLDSYTRIKIILEEAARELRNCFHGIDEILKNSKLDAGNLEKVNQQNRVSVRILQFEDIVQQILEHSQMQKLALAQTMRQLQEFTEKLDKSDTENSHELKKVIHQCKVELDQMVANHGIFNPVKQANLDSGDVELF